MIQWVILQPAEDIIKNFGPGFVLQGMYEGKKESFFILDEDKNKRKWGDIIAAKLVGKEEENAE